MQPLPYQPLSLHRVESGFLVCGTHICLSTSTTCPESPTKRSFMAFRPSVGFSAGTRAVDRESSAMLCGFAVENCTPPTRDLCCRLSLRILDTPGSESCSEATWVGDWSACRRSASASFLAPCCLANFLLLAGRNIAVSSIVAR